MSTRITNTASARVYTLLRLVARTYVLYVGVGSPLAVSDLKRWPGPDLDAYNEEVKANISYRPLLREPKQIRKSS